MFNVVDETNSVNAAPMRGEVLGGTFSTDVEDRSLFWGRARALDKTSVGQHSGCRPSPRFDFDREGDKGFGVSAIAFSNIPMHSSTDSDEAL